MSLLFLLLAVLTSTFTEFCKTSIVFLPFSHHCYILEDNLQYTEGKKKITSALMMDWFNMAVTGEMIGQSSRMKKKSKCNRYHRAAFHSALLLSSSGKASKPGKSLPQRNFCKAKCNSWSYTDNKSFLYLSYLSNTYLLISQR